MQLENLKQILNEENLTCLIYKDGQCFKSIERGVKPLVVWYSKKFNFHDAICLDKVVGAATAYLYVLHQVKFLYSKVISKPALDILSRYNIEVSYDILIDNIINRKGDDICPFEKCVMNVQTPKEAYEKIIHKMEEMNIKY